MRELQRMLIVTMPRRSRTIVWLSGEFWLRSDVQYRPKKVYTSEGEAVGPGLKDSVWYVMEPEA
jgi:hypothetical protein